MPTATIVIEHRDAPLGERHGPHNWEFDDDVDRLLARNFKPGDIGKWGYQVDTRQVWSLLSYDVVGVDLGLPTWEEVGAGGSGGGGDKHYVHVQSVPSTTWVIDHNLGKRPSLTAFDSAHTRIFGGEEHPTVNQAIMTYSTAISGTVDCN